LSSGPEPEPIDRFEFGLTMHRGMNMTVIKLPSRFPTVVDGTEDHVLLRSSYWTVEVLFDQFGEMYLANGWKWFCRVHEIEVGNFLVFNYDGHHTITASVFDDSMCCRHYIVAAHYTSSDDE
jgi:hypothetical protein